MKMTIIPHIYRGAWHCVAWRAFLLLLLLLLLILLLLEVYTDGTSLLCAVRGHVRVRGCACGRHNELTPDRGHDGGEKKGEGGGGAHQSRWKGERPS